MTTTYDIVALATLQFHVGGFLTMEPADHHVHLIRMARAAGTPGDTLCGLERRVSEGPGWSVGGGVGNPEAVACPECKWEADIGYPALPVWGSMWHGLFQDWRPEAPWDTRNLEHAVVWARA